MKEESANRRIAKNTLALYVRMLLSMAVSLYTSRVVLNTLGVEDYGTYGLVGSVVVLFTFLNGAMSLSTSRYLTYELGTGNTERLRRVFNCALWIHLGIVVLVVVLAETVGLWFLLNVLKIPAGRMGAAQWVYQLSVLASVVTITQVPYNASVMAHERMDFYSYVEIFGSFLKLGIVYLLVLAPYDKLIFYATLVFAVQLLLATIYRVYCIRHFPECHFRGLWDKELGRSMLSFSGWSLYSNLCFTSRQQGTNYLLNIFGGVAVNAAAGLATTTLYILEQFSNNLLLAARPPIIKSYACGDLPEMERLLCLTSTVANLLYLMVAIPFIAEMPYVLRLWLVNVPPYMTGFCVLLIVGAFISLNNNVIFIAIQASGRVRVYSMIAGTIALLVVPVLYLIFRFHGSLYWAYGLSIVSPFITYFYCLYSLSLISHNINLWYYVWYTLLRVLIICIPTIIVVLLLKKELPFSFSRFIMVCLFSVLLLGGLGYVVLLPQHMKTKIKQTIYLKISRKSL